MHLCTVVPWRKTLAAGWIKRSMPWIWWLGRTSPAPRHRVGMDPLDPSGFHSSSTTLLTPLCSCQGCLRERWEWALVSISSSLWLVSLCCCHQLPSKMSFLGKFRGNGKSRQLGSNFWAHLVLSPVVFEVFQRQKKVPGLLVVKCPHSSAEAHLFDEAEVMTWVGVECPAGLKGQCEGESQLTGGPSVQWPKYC